MPISFDRPVGACADSAELEYISALMQTEKLYLRQEGSLTARDIEYFLLSRYGVKIEREQIERDIIGEFGGSSLQTLSSSNVVSSTTGANNNGINSTLRSASTLSNGINDLNNGTELEVKVVKLGTGTEVGIEDVEVAPKLKSVAFREESPTRTAAHVGQQSLRRPPPSTKPMSLRMRTLRLSQQFDQEDYQRYQQYKSMRKINELNEDPLETVDGEMRTEMVIDLAQITSMLLIPKLRKLRELEDKAESKREANETLNTDTEEDIIDLVLAIILKETGLSYGQELTPEILTQIVVSPAITVYWSDHLRETMMQCATNASPDGIPRLDRETCLRVLTQDIMVYNVDCATSTHETPMEEVNSMKQDDDERELKRCFMASNIDTNADTYRSVTWTILSFYVVVVTILAYLFHYVTPIYLWKEPNCTGGNGSQMLCSIATATYNWLQLLVMLSVVGFPFYYLITQGNSIYYPENPHMATGLVLFSMAATFVFVLLPFFYKANFGLFHSGPSEEEVNNGDAVENNRTFLGPLSLGLGAILILVQSVQLVPNKVRTWARSCVGRTYVSSNLRSARETKQAAIFKIDRLVRNAAKCHLKDGSTTSTATQSESTQTQLTANIRPLSTTMVKYQQSFTETEKAGGILWTMRKVRDRTLFYEEGVWLWQRLVASNIAQWFTMFIWTGVIVAAQMSLSGQEEEQFEEFFPGFSNNQMIIVLTTGYPLAFFAAFFISATYIPSAMSTVVKYRSGVRGSLGDVRFLQNRFAMDSANLLFGAAFWTCLTSSGLIYVIVSLFTFLCMYSESQGTMIRLVSNVIGMLVTVCTKQLIMLIIRSRWSRGYYRSSPMFVNISNTIQEVWNLG